MPTNLPDHTTTRRPIPAPAAALSRRNVLRLLLPLGATTFTALADTDVVQRWLRCSFASPRSA